MDDRQILAQIEELLRTAPPNSEIHESKHVPWLGKAIAVIGQWYSLKGVAAQHEVTKIRSNRGLSIEDGYLSLLTLLHEGRETLAMATGAISVASGPGKVFDYFDNIRKLVQEARQELFFVDRYLDSDFASRYLPQVPRGVAVRLLTMDKKHLGTLIPAVKAYIAQEKVTVEIRTHSGFHGRWLFIDRARAYQSDASFKDGAKGAMAVLTQTIDVFNETYVHFDKLWNEAQKEQLP